MKTSQERVLVIACHPDDEVLGMGGSIAKFAAAGVPVRVLFLAEGVTARYNETELESAFVLDQIEHRERCALLAQKLLGLPENSYSFSRRHCCRLDRVPLIDLVKDIESQIEKFKPTDLFVHAEHDANVDHRIANQAVLAATRPLGSSPLTAIYEYEVLSSTEWNTNHPFQPNIFCDISQSLEDKKKAMVAYDREVRPAPHSRSPEVIEALARFRGAMCGLHFAESFKLVRGIRF